FASGGICAPAGTCGIAMRPAAGGGAITGGATWLGAGTPCARAESGSDAITNAAADSAKQRTRPERLCCSSPADRRIGGVQLPAMPIQPHYPCGIIDRQLTANFPFIEFVRKLPALGPGRL